MYSAYAYTFIISALIAVGLTAAVRKLALRWRILDHPGERKEQVEAVPLLGGVAIVAAFYLVVAGHALVLLPLERIGLDDFERVLATALGQGSTASEPSTTCRWRTSW